MIVQDGVGYMDLEDMGYGTPNGDTGLFGIKIKMPKIKIGKAFKSVGHAIGHATKPLGSVIKAASPILNVVRTGASFVPGVGTAIATGISGAQSLARGRSLAQMAQDAAISAMPGGAIAQQGLRSGIQAAQMIAGGRNVLGSLTSAAARGVTRYAKQQSPVAMMAYDALGRFAKGETPRSVVTRSLGTIGTALGKEAMAALAADREPTLAALSPSTMAKRLRVSKRVANYAASATRGLKWRALSPRASQWIQRFSLVPRNVTGRETGALSIDGRSYTVEPNDYGVKIAKKITGDGNRWRELKAANPTIAKRPDPKNYGFVIYPGDILALPESWYQFTAAKVSTQTMTAASVIQAEAILAAWAKTDGKDQPGFTDYGMRPEDVDGDWGPRDKFVMMSFQRWRKDAVTDGQLTEQTLAELLDWAEQAAGTTPLDVPAPTPVSTTLPGLPGLPQVTVQVPPAVTPPVISAPTPPVVPALPTPTPEPVSAPTTTALPSGLPPGFDWWWVKPGEAPQHLPSAVPTLPTTPPVITSPNPSGTLPTVTPPETSTTGDATAPLLGVAAAALYAFNLI